MAWNDFLGGDQLTPTDPLQILQSIAGSAPPEAVTRQGVAPKIPNLPHDVIPTRPVGPIEQAVQPGGTADWKSLLTQLGPLLASMALHEPAQRTGFLNGYMQGHSLAQQEKDKRTAATQAKNQAAANYRLEVGNHAQAITDPVQRAQFIDNAEQSGVLAGLLKPGDLASMRDVPPGQQAQARLRELVDHLTTLEKNGYNLDELAQANATIKLNDGHDVPVSMALDLTRERPLDAAGKPIAKPPAAGKTAEERFLAAWAKDHNKTVDTLTSAEQLQAKTEYANAARERVTPTIAPGSVDAQFNDLVALWKEGHPGEEPPLNVRTQLRKQANEVNDRPKSFGGMDSLYSDVDPKAIAAQIRAGGHPPDIAQYGRPAAAAIASELARKGPNGEPPFNLASAQREWRAQMNLNRTMNGSQQVRLDESIRSGLAMYDKVDQLADQWDSRGWGPLSRANLALAREGAKGPKAQSLANQLTGQIGQLTSDVATIEQGGLTPTNEARAVAEKSLQDWWGKGTIKDMTAQGRSNMQIRHLARNTQDVMVPGNGQDVSPAKPATPAAPPAPKEGDTQPITDPGYPAGAMKTFTKGQWIRTK